MMAPSSDRLAIVGAGAVSAVGRGIVDSCASVRAGINRGQGVRHFAVLDAETQELVPLRGHAIPELTDGFSPSARWQLLARRAVVDLMAELPPSDGDPKTYWSQCGVVFVLPVLDDARFFNAAPARPDVIWGSCLEGLIEEFGLSSEPSHRALVAVGPGGLARAFEIGEEWLAQSQVARVLVIAADSLLDAWSLDWLARAERLKQGSNPVGLEPGEAAAALLLERTRGASRPPLALVRTAVFEDADEPFQNVERQQGRAAAAALRRALQEVGPRLDGELYTNVNGEPWRAIELGSALSALAAHLGPAYRPVMPAGSLGDVGAAAGAMAIACVIRSFARGYARARQAWVLATSDYGEASAFCLEAV